ncbi:hypothetical protein CEXT_398761 [Caerostris extrusa]|uniref:Uncharacterized protein n=1 Tax=Caerostris extrusa TaxID=172846 RepID=A0AAV4PNH5_CAEEX|nr:hypothetical protein CEXT_398761 [Caerostris extrusa]
MRHSIDFGGSLECRSLDLRWKRRFIGVIDLTLFVHLLVGGTAITSTDSLKSANDFGGEGRKALPVGSAGRAGVRPRSVHRSPEDNALSSAAANPSSRKMVHASGIHSATSCERGSLGL